MKKIEEKYRNLRKKEKMRKLRKQGTKQREL